MGKIGFDVNRVLLDIGDSPAPKKSKSKADKSAKSDKASEKGTKGKGKGKKQKAEKDPNAPKKPLTAFMLYTNKRRPEIMAKTPGTKITEISAAIGKEWTNMTGEEKDVSSMSNLTYLIHCYSLAFPITHLEYIDMEAKS